MTTGQAVNDIEDGAGRQDIPEAEADGRARPHLGVPHVPMPHVSMPHVSMPTGRTGRVLWWGGLATVAALGIVDWPVAALVAAGSWVAEQHARQEPRHPDADVGTPGQA